MSEIKGNPYIQDTSKANALPGAGKKVVVAMSGGVDSSVTAALLKRQGYEVVGIALQTTDYSKYLKDESGGTCCSMKDMEDARRVAETIGIPFYVLDTEKTFDANVVDYFVNEYMQGRTPNPCVMCNTKVKFNHLYRKAMDMGADFIATGHYARLSKEPELGYCLWKAKDEAKDQTYFLFNLTQRQLEKTLFPLGGLTKPEVRKMAEEFGLTTAEKPDSQEICFVPPDGYAKFIEDRTSPSMRKGGYIVTTENQVLGNHDGVFKYTLGQRKGLGPALTMAKNMGIHHADQFYVVKIDAIRNLVVLGLERDLMRWGLMATNLNWIVAPDLRQPKRVQVKIRHRAPLVDAEIRLLGDNRLEVRFVEAQRAITPGQAVVMYDGNLCLGGGWIQEVISVNEAERPSKSGFDLGHESR
ncbi:MAG: tRNA 2-thiouridine(34) synthase MnmA [Bdellovibrionales bacterium]|nr:tRNA 2-thiouridine(34) synthase MnmA [Bdellovibrionales bacterium]